MHPMLNIATQAIRKASNFIIQQYKFFDKKNTQSDYISGFISKIHKESNKIIVTVIQKFYPLHIIIFTTRKNSYIINDNHTSNTCWIITSIDNNINFIKQFPFFALSIAVQYKKKTEVGVIYDPIHNELFSACRGKGAYFNGYRIRINNNTTYLDFSKIILAISFSYEKENIAINLLNKLSYHSIDFRRTGSLNLDLAYVSIGRIDGCIILLSLKEDKLTAVCGALIIRESGGFIVDLNGNEVNNNIHIESIISGTSKIIKTILPIIQ